jgi:hypothetical protein
MLRIGPSAPFLMVIAIISTGKCTVHNPLPKPTAFIIIPNRCIAGGITEVLKIRTRKDL